MNPRILSVVLASSVLASAAIGMGPLGDGFTYQRSLSEGGVPVDAAADFEFGLWDAAVGGAMVGVIDAEDAVRNLVCSRLCCCCCCCLSKRMPRRRLLSEPLVDPLLSSDDPVARYS